MTFRERMLACALAFLLALALAAMLPQGANAQAQLQDGTAFLGHAVVTGAPPTLTGCTIVAGSTDTAGQCATTATSGTITFSKAFATAPFCLVVDASATSTVSMPVYTVSTTAITLSTIISGHNLAWACFGRSGN